MISQRDGRATKSREGWTSLVSGSSSRGWTDTHTFWQCQKSEFWSNCDLSCICILTESWAVSRIDAQCFFTKQRWVTQILLLQEGGPLLLKITALNTSEGTKEKGGEKKNLKNLLNEEMVVNSHVCLNIQGLDISIVFFHPPHGWVGWQRQWSTVALFRTSAVDGPAPPSATEDVPTLPKSRNLPTRTGQEWQGHPAVRQIEATSSSSHHTMYVHITLHTAHGKHL